MVGKPGVGLLKTDPVRFWLWTVRWLLEDGKLDDARAVFVDLLEQTENGREPARVDVRAELCAAWAAHKLDTQVARAMGWTLKASGYPVNFWLGPDGTAVGYCDQTWPEDAERYGDAPLLFSGKGVWSPSTDWSAAGQVVQVLRCGWNGHAAAVVEMIVYDCLPPDCEVSIYGPDLARVDAGPYNSMPEAICRAFLEAAREEANDDTRT